MLFYLGDDKTLEVVGMGNIGVIMTMGNKKLDNVFNNVLYILKIVKNLFLMSKGHSAMSLCLQDILCHQKGSKGGSGWFA